MIKIPLEKCEEIMQKIWKIFFNKDHNLLQKNIVNKMTYLKIQLISRIIIFKMVIVFICLCAIN